LSIENSLLVLTPFPANQMNETMGQILLGLPLIKSGWWFEAGSSLACHCLLYVL